MYRGRPRVACKGEHPPTCLHAKSHLFHHLALQAVIGVVEQSGLAAGVPVHPGQQVGHVVLVLEAVQERVDPEKDLLD